LDKRCACPVAFAHPLNPNQVSAVKKEPLGAFLCGRQPRCGKEAPDAIMSGPLAMANHCCPPYDNVILVESGGVEELEPSSEASTEEYVPDEAKTKTAKKKAKASPRIWVFEAGENLDPDDELVWDYGEGYWENKKVKCLCKLCEVCEG
jgi:hypothetical protein